MEYLRQEYEDYKKARERGETFEQCNPFKAHAFISLARQLQPHLRSGSRILEVGFGSGYGLSLLEALGNRTVGAEIADYTFDYANSVYDEKGLTPRLVKADGFQLPFQDDSFDLVLNVGTIEHFVPERQKHFVKEMARVSRDQVLISTPNDSPDSGWARFKQSPVYCPEEEHLLDLNELSQNLGLEVTRTGGFHAASTQNARSIDELQEREFAMNDQDRARFGFLKYTLSRKNKGLKTKRQAA